MEAATQVKIESLAPYRHLFPAAQVADKTVKMGATVADTVDFIPQVVQKTRWQVEKFVEKELQGLSTYIACEKLWHFVKYHIRYKKDKRGYEQVRSPRRLIHDAVGDCDCFTTFIDTCLNVLNIPIINRITKYDGKDYFQHIYPIVPLGNGKYIIMDCVADKFNYEVPYTEKKDYKMELQFLDGIDNDTFSGSVDAQDLFGWNDDMGDLGKLFKKRASKSSSAMPEGNQGGKKGKKRFQKIKNFAKKALNVTNKINPATALLRAGILASMKLNVMKVAQNLKWAYLTEDEARKKGADMGKFGRLKNILYKIEQIFYTAGGKPENLKKAILSGKGNRNKEVSGFGLVDPSEIQVHGLDDNNSLPQLLGAVYQDEFVSGLEGTEGLGAAVATGAALASATTIMGTIAALLKAVGGLFPKKKGEEGGGDGGSGEGGSSEGGGGDEGGSEATVTTSSGDSEDSGNTPAKVQNKIAKNESTDEDAGEDNGTNGSKKAVAKTTDDEAAPTGLKGFWENNKKWIKPVGIGAAVVGILYAGYRMVKSNKEKKPATNGQAVLNGFNGRKHKKRKKGKRGGTAGKKSSIALM
jgi:hypothetical protein